MVGDLGGYLGLFLGWSLYSLLAEVRAIICLHFPWSEKSSMKQLFDSGGEGGRGQKQCSNRRSVFSWCFSDRLLRVYVLWQRGWLWQRGAPQTRGPGRYERVDEKTDKIALCFLRKHWNTRGSCLDVTIKRSWWALSTLNPIAESSVVEFNPLKNVVLCWDLKIWSALKSKTKACSGCKDAIKG